MGEIHNQPFQLSCNASLKIDFRGSRVTSGGGLVLVRELNERIEYAHADHRAIPSVGIAEAMAAGKSIGSHLGRRGCLTKAEGKAALSTFGTRDGVDRALSRAPGPSQRKIVHWNPTTGSIVWGWCELKGEFRIKGFRIAVC